MSGLVAALDTHPLTDPVDKQAVKAFARGRRSKGSGFGAWVLFIAVFLFIAVVFMVVVGGISISVLQGVTRGEFPSVIGVVPVLIVGFVVAMLISAAVESRKKRVRDYRIYRFAEANGFAYVDGVSAPPLPGVIFQPGSSKRASQLVRANSPRFVEYANYQYTTGSGKNKSTHHWGYVAIKLEVPLPNIVLDALSNNSLGTNLPASFTRDQRLSLEGDFNRYFTLYCPEGYEPDALYLFTPDIMARFIDNAAELDVEIVDDWMFLYMQRAVSTDDPATWTWLIGTVGALITKLDQWARWRDERLRLAQSDAAGAESPSPVGLLNASQGSPPPHHAPPPGVAPQGRRLKRGVKWVPIVLFAAYVAFWIWTTLN